MLQPVPETAGTGGPLWPWAGHMAAPGAGEAQLAGSPWASHVPTRLVTPFLPTLTLFGPYSFIRLPVCSDAGARIPGPGPFPEPPYPEHGGCLSCQLYDELLVRKSCEGLRRWSALPCPPPQLPPGDAWPVLPLKQVPPVWCTLRGGSRARARPWLWHGLVLEGSVHVC